MWVINGKLPSICIRPHIRTLQKIEAGETNILVTTALRLQRAIGGEWTALMPAR